MATGLPLNEATTAFSEARHFEDGEEALLAIYKRLKPVLERLAFHSLDNRADVEDTVQDALARVTPLLRAGKLTNPFAYAARVTRNCATERNKKKLSGSHSEEEVEGLLQGEAIAKYTDEKERDERFAILETVMNNLDPSCRRLLHLLYIEDEASDLLMQKWGITRTLFHVRTYRCKNKARKLFETYAAV